MTTKQEIIDALNRENEGAAPPALFTQTGTIAQMDACGCYWPDAFYDIDKMIELALQPSKLFGFPTVRIPFDITYEAERLGCTISKGTKESQPAVTESPWASEEIPEPPEDLMSIDEFLSGGRVAMHIEAARRIAKEHPELFLTSNMDGPQSVAAYMVGMENFIMGLFMAPDTCEKWVQKVAPYQYALGRVLSEASDNVMVIVEAAEELIPGDCLDQFVMPYEKELFSNFKESFSLAHTCGMVDNVMERLTEFGATVLSVESYGEPQNIMDRVGDKVLLAGGVDPIATLLQGTPESIVAAAKKADAAGYSIIMPECGVPPQTSNANLEALAKYREL